MKPTINHLRIFLLCLFAFGTVIAFYGAVRLLPQHRNFLEALSLGVPSIAFTVFGFFIVFISASIYLYFSRKLQKENTTDAVKEKNNENSCDVNENTSIMENIVDLMTDDPKSTLTLARHAREQGLEEEADFLESISTKKQDKKDEFHTSNEVTQQTENKNQQTKSS